ncbi:MAG TPA: hypothetical protein VF315_00090 [Steroidobacteraceae bacterium]
MTAVSVSLLCTLLLAARALHAEPYLAIQQGYKCVQCHVNPTGGGMRNAFGDTFAQTQIATSRFDPAAPVWTGVVSQYLSIGGDVRGDLAATHVKGQSTTHEFDLQEARAYAEATVIPGRLSVYVDERVAPGGASNMEAYLRLFSANAHWNLQAGQMFLPYGLRLQDDSAFVRQVTGINMTTPDTGVQLGYESGPWSAQVALTNGSAGGAATGKGSEVTSQVVYVTGIWRLGVAASFNDAQAAKRRVQGIFAGLRTGPIAWLAEADLVVDNGFPEGQRKLASALLEGDWNVRQGHNVKLTAEVFDPDRSVANDAQTRWSALYEYTPVEFLQLRGGLRWYEGIPQNDQQNRRVLFVELHGYF